MAALARAAQPRPGRLRVGVFADSPRQPRWLAEAFARIAASDFAVIALLAFAGAAAAPAPWLPRLYGRLDRWAFGPEPCEPVDLAAQVPHERRLEGGPWTAAALGAPPLDVAFAVGEVDDAALDGLARFGVWRFRVDGAREAADGAPLTRSALCARLAPDAPPRLAYESCSRTYGLSVARNRAALLEKTGQFAWRALRELHRSGGASLERAPPAHFATRGQAAALGGGDFCRIAARILRRAAGKALHLEQWFLAFRFGGGLPGADLAGFTRLMPPLDRDWADPFALEKDGRHYVFFEELPYAAGKAHIAMVEIGPDGRCSAPVPVLERDYHLSYPFVFEHEGGLYMVPETARSRAVELYRCVDFPRRWRLERRLIEGRALADATLHRNGAGWWMFAAAPAGETRMFDDELHLFHARSLDGEWRPHGANPVKSDVRRARPAGALYRHGGALYRPAQICAPRYGAGLSLNRVIRLAREAYAEREVARIVPGPQDGLLGLHTLNRAGYLTVVDAFTRRLRF